MTESMFSSFVLSKQSSLFERFDSMPELLVRFLINVGFLFFWLQVIYRFKWKKSHISWGAVFGALAFILGFSFELLLVKILGSHAFQIIFVGSTVEEVTKIIVILLGLHFDRPFKIENSAITSDFMKFGAMVGLFVAFFENLGKFDILTTIRRCIVSWPFHMIPPAIASVGILELKIKKNHVKFILFLALAVFVHMSYNLTVYFLSFFLS